MADKYFARMPFTYDGKELDRGQIVELAGAVNDEKLTRLGYLQKLNSRAATSQCLRCGEKFESGAYLDNHGRLRHSGREFTADDLEQEQNRAMQQTPLHLDKTAASKSVKTRV